MEHHRDITGDHQRAERGGHKSVAMGGPQDNAHNFPRASRSSHGSTTHVHMYVDAHPCMPCGLAAALHPSSAPPAQHAIMPKVPRLSKLWCVASGQHMWHVLDHVVTAHGELRLDACTHTRTTTHRVQGGQSCTMDVFSSSESAYCHVCGDVPRGRHGPLPSRRCDLLPQGLARRIDAVSPNLRSHALAINTFADLRAWARRAGASQEKR